MLWKKLKADDFDTDIIEVLRESNDDISKQLDGLSRDDFSEVYLFFDYDMHQTNLGKEDDADAVKQMLESFDNETVNGKLYISYPMVEALRDYKSGICGDRVACFVAITDMKEYKNASAVRAVNPQFKEYDYEMMKKNEYVSLESLEKIANVLDCDIGDLVEIVKKDTKKIGKDNFNEQKCK